MQVKDIMHTEVKCCRNDDDLNTVTSLMWNEDYGVVPVVNDGNILQGIITDRDVSMAAMLKHRPLWGIKCSELLEKKPCYSCRTTDDIHEILQQMGENQVHRMPVVDAQNSPVGMISVKDILEHTPDIAEAGKEGTEHLSSPEVIHTLKMIHRSNAVMVRT